MDLRTLPFDVFIFVLRVSFVFLLYFFLYQVIRAVSQDLKAIPMNTGYPPAYRANQPGQSSDSIMDEELPAQLIVVDAGKSGLPLNATFDLEPVTTIGRRAGNAIILNDDFVSSDHAIVSWQEEQWWFSDEGSTNGSFLNGARVTNPVLLQPNDIITIGRVKMRLSA